jgi:hypothetical protein
MIPRPDLRRLRDLLRLRPTLASDHGRVTLTRKKNAWVLTGYATGGGPACVMRLPGCGCGRSGCPKTAKSCRCGGHHWNEPEPHQPVSFGEPKRPWRRGYHREHALRLAGDLLASYAPPPLKRAPAVPTITNLGAARRPDAEEFLSALGLTYEEYRELVRAAHAAAGSRPTVAQLTLKKIPAR